MQVTTTEVKEHLEVEEKRTNILSTDRRTEKRLTVNVPVEVTWTADSKQQITERTFIEDVSDFGCRFSTREALQQGDTVSVQLLGVNGKPVPSETPKMFKIMWVSRKATGMTVGARILPGDNLANTKFKPDTTTTKTPLK